MSEGKGWKYKNFLIVEKPSGVFNAYRSPRLWDSGITSYSFEAEDRTRIEQEIDNANDEGDFDPALGPPAMFFGQKRKYGVRILWKSTHTMSEFLEEADSYIKAVTQVMKRVGESDVLQLDITNAPEDW